MVNFDNMIRTDRSYEHEQLRASKLEEIRKLSLARRGLTSQQNSRTGARNAHNTILVQPYPSLCPKLQTFNSSVLTPKHLAQQNQISLGTSR